MTAGDPQNCNISPPYYNGSHWIQPWYPGYYYFTPTHNFCPCCGQRLMQNSLGAGGGQAIGIAPQAFQGPDNQGYAGYNRSEPA